MADRRNPQPELGEAVRRLRKDRALSTATVASRAGLSERWLRDVEAGKSNPTWGHVRDLAEALKVPLEELASVATDLESG